MARTDHAVLIVGGGPTGLMLASELALAGVDVAIVERRENQELEGSRGGGLHPRSLEVLDHRGIADRFVGAGKKYPVTMFAGRALDASDLPSRFNYWLAIWQSQTERVLAGWVDELKVPVYRRSIVADFVQDERGVRIQLEDKREFECQWLVGCDGGRSIVRKKLGIDFIGWEPDVSYLIYEADMAQEPRWGLNYGARGTYAVGKLDDTERVRGVVTENELVKGDRPTFDELCQALVSCYGTDYGVHNVTWLSRFSDATRQATEYRQGRVLIAGDAAHVHSPVGGQGLNLGLLDAVNLGWKLAQVAKGVSPDGLLDTYKLERHPAAAAVLRTTLALTALGRGDERTNALRDMMGEAMSLDEARRWYTARMSGLDLRYGNGDGHPLLGRRMPDIEIVTPQGPLGLFSLLRDCRPVLVNFGQPGTLDTKVLSASIKHIEGKCGEGAWNIPGLGPHDAPSAVLVRPDGHIAWVGEGEAEGLVAAAEFWFGP